MGVDGQQHADGSHHDANTPSVHSVGTNNSAKRITETMLQTKIVVAYSTHLMHTLHILLNGKWDPISLLDDNDLWISSQGFISATSHAVSAAEAINDIMEYDPDLSFMPFFFGIYLLQGSFLLLLIADKLQGEASPSVVKACETIVRAHEACVVTLNTEYQVRHNVATQNSVDIVLTKSTEKLPKSHAIRPFSSPRQNTRRFWRKPDAPQGGAESLQVVWRWYRTGSLKDCKNDLPRQKMHIRTNFQFGLYEDNGFRDESILGKFTLRSLRRIQREKGKRGKQCFFMAPPHDVH